MQKPITPTMHGMLDYATSAAVMAAPRIWDMPDNAKRLFDTLAVGYTGLSGVTDYPLSVRRTVPFKAHGAAEAVIGVALPVLPYVLGFSHNKPARNLCFGLAALTFIVASLTDWNSPEADRNQQLLPQ